MSDELFGSGAPARDLGSGRPYLSPGARKEKLRRRDYHLGGPRAPLPPLRYTELHAASAFSFLAGASLPEDLVDRAAALGLPSIALLDRNGVYGAPRFYQAAKAAGLRALVGSEVALGAEAPMRHPEPSRESGARARGAALTDRVEPARLSLLVASRTGYRNLCKLLTAAARGRPKGEAVADWALLEAHAEGLWALTGGDEGPLAAALDGDGTAGARRYLERLAHVFERRVHVELQRHGRREEEHRNQALVELARQLRLPLVATNGVRYARRQDKPLFDVLTAIRQRTTLDAAGSLLAAQRQRHLRSAAEMARLFADLPQAVAASAELAARLDFTLADLGYRFPDYPLPPGETPAAYLRHVTWNGARARFRPLSARAQTQIEKELALIEKLDLAGYFLIVWDLVQFCQREKIMAQGRGSAANSAVCYALSITAVDPVKMELLFERFLSEERGEWPDIDLDLPSGDQREKVIQYVYSRYGPAGAAMTANVITYRDRSAAREVAKVLGFSAEQVDRIAKQLGTFRSDTDRGDPKSLDQELTAAGVDPAEPRVALFATYWRRIQNLPRHLGQHSGGMVIAAGRLDEVVPLEPAAMPGRVVVQWDKDDCADLGIIKVDLLGLGMLNALEEAIPIIRERERVHVDLAHLPPDDPQVYAMLRRADTVGVFQVESRAQMASLPRNAPEKFYDLVIQVAIIRPGPIVGGMVRPFFDRRLGRAPVEHLHPCLAPILERTLGVPLFQEQLLRIAMVAAGFSGGEAEELRRAMGFKRSAERMQTIERKLRAGMAARGIVGETQDKIVQSITSFALYGFPESHAASFALIAYASAYLKQHHPTAFLIALLNAWPMGFYHPATLVQDAMRHGVEVRPIDVNHSDWRCTWEDGAEPTLMAGKDRALSAAADGSPLDPPRRAALPASRRDGQFSPPSRSGSLGRGASRLLRGKLSVATRYVTEERAARRYPEPDGGESRPPLSRTESDAGPAGACRLGLRYLSGLRQETGEAIARARRARPFADAEDLQHRCGLRAGDLDRLAEAGALASLGLSRRAALWQAALAVRPTTPLFAAETEERREERVAEPSAVYERSRERAGSSPEIESSSPLPEMTPWEETRADFTTAGMTTGRHPVAYFRAALRARGVLAAADLAAVPDGRRVRTAGSVIVRQRPGTAKGMLFFTLEDETGMSQAIVGPKLLQENRQTLVGASGLVVEGILEQRDGTVSIKAERFWPLTALAAASSHDFR